MAARAQAAKSSPVKRRQLQPPAELQEAKADRHGSSEEEEEEDEEVEEEQIAPSRGSHSSLGSLRSNSSHTFALSAHNVPDTLLGRESERTAITTFLHEHIRARASGSLYMAGKPGTGKTATITEVLREIELTPSLNKAAQVVQVNCMQLTNPRDVFRRLLAALRGTAVRLTVERAQAELFEELARTKKMLVLVLDEIDQLMLQKDAEVLYTLFEWPTRLRNVLVIGIANAVDLTERQLPMLELLAKKGLRPDTVIFKAYTKEQLIAIIKQRLATCDDPKVLADPAVIFCASKVTATSGDVRLALDLCRRVIDKAARSPLNHLKLMVDTCEEVFASGSQSRVQPLTVHQRLLLLALCRLDGFTKVAVLGKIYETYYALCRRTSLPAMGEHDLNSAFEVLRCMGVVKTADDDAPSPKKRARTLEKRDTKVRLSVPPDEVKKACAESVFAPVLEEDKPAAVPAEL